MMFFKTTLDDIKLSNVISFLPGDYDIASGNVSKHMKLSSFSLRLCLLDIVVRLNTILDLQ